MKSFALIGAAGYVAPRHMKAIKAVGGELKVAFDPNDSVGVIDSYFPDANFFVEFERFDRHIDKLRRRGQKIDYVSICSPNYMHDAHCRFALRSQADAICEKPLVLNPMEHRRTGEIESDTGRKISTILQLRLHPAIQALKDRDRRSPAKRHRHRLDLYHLARALVSRLVERRRAEVRRHRYQYRRAFLRHARLRFWSGAANVVHLRERERAAGYLIAAARDPLVPVG